MSQQSGDAGTAPPSPLPTATDDRQRLFSVFFFAVYFFLLYQLFRVLAPFLAPLLSAVMLALVVFPLRQLLERALRRPNVAALLTTIIVTVTVVVPVSVLAWLLVREAGTAIPAVREWLAGQQGEGQSFAQGPLAAPLLALWETVSGYAAIIELDLRAVALAAVRDIGNRVTTAGAAMVREFFIVQFQLIIFIAALFFFLRDGPRMIAALIDLVPMENANKAVVINSLDRTLVAMVRGTVVTAVAQGTMTGLGLGLFGLPYPILLGFAATFLSVVPFVGAALVWIPAAVYLLLTDHTVAAVGLTIWGLLVVGMIDNVLRPWVVGGHSRLPITLLFLAVLGGIQVYGLIGGLLSPLLLASVFAFARIYRERYPAQSK